MNTVFLIFTLGAFFYMKYVSATLRTEFRFIGNKKPPAIKPSLTLDVQDESECFRRMECMKSLYVNKTDGDRITCIFYKNINNIFWKLLPLTEDLHYYYL